MVGGKALFQKQGQVKGGFAREEQVHRRIESGVEYGDIAFGSYPAHVLRTVNEAERGGVKLLLELAAYFLDIDNGRQFKLDEPVHQRRQGLKGLEVDEDSLTLSFRPDGLLSDRAGPCPVIIGLVPLSVGVKLLESLQDLRHRSKELGRSPSGRGGGSGRVLCS